MLRMPRVFAAAVAAPRGPRRISAMVRVKNEAEYLGVALDSIVEHVDQIVLIDNLSTDATPTIIREFARQHPGMVTVREYPHAIARPGAESKALARDPAARNSPALLANYYTWCLQWCDAPYVLKWDGDMVATRETHEAIRAFKRSDRQALWLNGLNVYPDLEHAISDWDTPGPVSPRAVAPSEPRVFPKRFARYTSALGVYEALGSPYLHGFFALHWSAPAFLHLPLCKSTPFHNNSSDYRWPNPWTIPPGQRLPESMLEAVRQRRLTSYCRPPAEGTARAEGAGPGAA
jgi:glycosyltransferase involved in cell wall biosynthesis